MTEEQVQAIEFLAKRCDYGYGTAHARKITDLSTSLFDQLSAIDLLPGMSASERRTLFAASLVHNIGVSPKASEEIGLLPPWVPTDSGADVHGSISFQALRSWLDNPPSRLLANPLSSADRSALLYSVLWHSASKPYEIPDEPLVNPDSTMKLAGILRIAEGLDMHLRSLVAGIRVMPSATWIRILARSIGTVSDEVAAARGKSDLLAQALGLRVFVQQVIQ